MKIDALNFLEQCKKVKWWVSLHISFIYWDTERQMSMILVYSKDLPTSHVWRTSGENKHLLLLRASFLTKSFKKWTRSLYLSRSRDTLAVIENELNKEFQGSPSEIFSEKIEKFPRSVVLSNLREIDLYDWEGKHKSEVEERFPRSYKAWIEGNPKNFIVNDAEQLRQLLFELFQRARIV